jgi:hypothetical protein
MELIQLRAIKQVAIDMKMSPHGNPRETGLG